MTRDPLSFSADRLESRRSTRRRSGRERRARNFPAEMVPADFVRHVPAYEILSDERLSEIEEHADWILRSGYSLSW